MGYSFFVSHAHSSSVSKCAAMPIYQSVSMHKSTSAGLHRTTPLYHYILYLLMCSIILRVIVCSFVSHAHFTFKMSIRT